MVVSGTGSPIVRSWKTLKGAPWLRTGREVTWGVTESPSLFLILRSVNRVYLFSCVIITACMCRVVYVLIDRFESSSTKLSMSVTPRCPLDLQILPISFMAEPLVIPGLEASIGPICSFTNTDVGIILSTKCGHEGIVATYESTLKP